MSRKISKPSGHGRRVSRLFAIAAALVYCVASAADAPAKTPPAPAAEEPADAGWARQLGGKNRDWILGLATGTGGEVYATGYFHGTTDMAAGRPLESAGNSDVFVVKLDPAGEVRWARRFGGGGQDEGRSVAAAADGGVYVTGFFSGEASFGSAAETVLRGAGTSDVFVLKIDPDGELAWARRLGGKLGDVGYAVAAIPGGGVYVTGYFQGVAGLDAAAPALLESAGSNDVFVLRLDAAGELVWARRLGGRRGDQGRALAVVDGGVAVLGNFEDVITCAAGELESAGRADVLLWRLDEDGKETWTRRFGGPGPDSGEALAASADGTLFATGSFFGDAELGPVKLEGGGVNDVFVVAVAPAGTVRWARGIGGEGNDFGFGVAPAVAGGVWVAGFSQLARAEATVSGEAEGFVERFDAAGEPWSRRSLGRGAAIQLLGLALDPMGTPIVAGMFRGAVVLELGAGPVELPGAGKFDLFIARLAGGG